MKPWLKQLIKAPLVKLSSHAPVLRRIILWRIPQHHAKVALTFDDGPHPVYTPQTLDILAEHSVKATFFVLGSMVEKCPEVFRRIVDEGHEVGIHGYTHTLDNMGEQALRTLEIISRFGVKTTLFRPPGGVLRAEIGLWMVRNGFSTVLWSFDARDSMRHEGKHFFVRPYDEIGPGDIMLMHDDNPVCVADLKQVIPKIQRKRLGTAVISEFLAS